MFSILKWSCHCCRRAKIDGKNYNNKEENVLPFIRINHPHWRHTLFQRKKMNEKLFFLLLFSSLFWCTPENLATDRATDNIIAVYQGEERERNSNAKNGVHLARWTLPSLLQYCLKHWNAIMRICVACIKKFFLQKYFSFSMYFMCTQLHNELIHNSGILFQTQYIWSSNVLNHLNC